MRRFTIAAIGAVLAVAMAAPAKAGIVFNYSTSSTTIDAGGSVSINVFADFTLDGSLVDAIQPFYPGYFVQAYSYDWTRGASANFTAAGSVEQNGFASSQETYFGPHNYSPVKFTYDTPGDYIIDFSFAANIRLFPVGLVFDSPAMNILEYGPMLDGPTYTTFGTGEIDVYVSAVPEPSTWAMMLLGFIFIAAAARSRRLSLT